jgi:hypothetical protein
MSLSDVNNYYLSKDSMEQETKTQEVVNNIKATSKKIRIIVAVLVLAVIMVGGVFMWFRYTKTAEYVKHTQEQETAQLIKKIRAHLVLPDEQPSIFSVQDPEVLIKQQAFFAGVEKGDQLLIYPTTSKAIVYSVKKDMILNVGPVTFDQKNSSATNLETVSKPVENKK